MNMPIQRQSEQFGAFDTGVRWARERASHELPKGLAGLVNSMGPRISSGMLNTRTAGWHYPEYDPRVDGYPEDDYYDDRPSASDLAYEEAMERGHQSDEDEIAEFGHDPNRYIPEDAMKREREARRRALAAHLGAFLEGPAAQGGRLPFELTAGWADDNPDYDDILKRIDDQLAGGEPGNLEDYFSDDYLDGPHPGSLPRPGGPWRAHDDDLSPDAATYGRERYEGEDFPGATCDHCNSHFGEPFEVNDVSVGGDHKGKFCDDCIHELMPSWYGHRGAGRTAAKEPIDDLTQRKAFHMVRNWLWNHLNQDNDEQMPNHWGSNKHGNGDVVGGPRLHPDFHPYYQHPFTGQLVPSEEGPSPHILMEGAGDWTTEASADEDLTGALRDQLGIGIEPYHTWSLSMYKHQPMTWPKRDARTALVAPAAGQQPAMPIFQPGHRVGLPWRDQVIRGTVISVDPNSLNPDVRWDDGQYSSEEPRNIHLL